MGIILLDKRSDPLMLLAAKTGLTLADAVWLGLSPIAFSCDENWKPLLARLCEKGGYTWEWIPDPNQPEEIPDYLSRSGEAVLIKVGT